MLEKFDFSKIEDRGKFEKLSKEVREEIIDEAQGEASSMEEVVGGKGSKEDYEIAVKLVEEKTLANSKETFKEIFEQRLNDILYSQLTVENIETFADNAITQTINLTGDILLKHRDNVELSDNGILANKEQEDKAFLFFGLPNVTEILDSIIEKKGEIDNLKTYLFTKVKDIDKVITPTDGERENNAGGGGQWAEQRRMFPRVLTVLYILEHDFSIPPADVSITKGAVTPDMMRQTPYMRIEIPDLDRVVYLCDEEGNVSYVFDAIKIKEQNIPFDTLDVYSKEDKNSLIARYHGIGIRIRQTKDWRNNIALALSEPIPERDLPENTIRKSEFEKKVFLPFENFQNEVRSLYQGEGGVEKWYREKQKGNKNWPAAPYKMYRGKGWEGWSELVEKENRLKIEYLSFENFQNEVRSLYQGEGDVQKWYREKQKGNKNWPSNPQKMYKNKGWEGWTELVGKEKVFLPFENFQNEVRSLYQGEGDIFRWYRRGKKNHKNWPSNPSRIYKNKEWVGWRALVGKENRLKKK